MRASELLSLYRREMRDSAEPYLVADSDIYTYLTDAQRMFCRLTDGIEDSLTPSVVEASIDVGDEWVRLSPLILKVRSARRVDTGEPMHVIDAEDADAQGLRFDGVPGVPRALVGNFTAGALRVWPMPNEAAALILAVQRMPLLSLSASQDRIEIREEHHLALLDWVKHKVYSIPDAELYDRQRAELHENKFRAYCAAAKVEQVRLRHTAGTVRYGGL